MKKLLMLSSILCVTILPGCVKEIKTSDSQPVSLVSQPASSRQAPATSILQQQWSYGSSTTDMGFGITKAPDGSGYILAGYSLGNNGDVPGNHGGADAWVLKIDLNGNVLWKKVFGGTGGDYAYDIVTTEDGGYIFSGATNSTDGDLAGQPHHGDYDTWVVKLSASGNIVWQKVLGGSGTERGESIIQTIDKGYVIGSYTNSSDGDILANHGDYDTWIIKLNNSGEVDWQKTYGGSLRDGANGSSIIETPEGLLVCSESNSLNGDLQGLSNHGGTDTWVFAINGSGNPLWGKTYGGTGGEGSGTIAAVPGGYVFSVNTSSNDGDVSGNHGYSDTWVVKIDAAGNLGPRKCFGGFDMDVARIRHIEPTTGNIILAGYTFSKNGDIPTTKGGEDVWILRLDANLNKKSSDVLGGRGGDMANDAIPTADGMYITTGRSSSTTGDVTGNHGGNDMWVVKFNF